MPDISEGAVVHCDCGAVHHVTVHIGAAAIEAAISRALSDVLRRADYAAAASRAQFTKGPTDG